MKCYRCSTKNPEDAPYCHYCGAPLAREESAEERSGIPSGDEGLLPPQEAYYEQNRPKRISFFTRNAYRVLSSKHRYAWAFALLACFGICLILLAVMLTGVGNDAMHAFELAGRLSGTREVSVVQEAQQAWRLLWSYVALFCICGAGMVVSSITAYKMVKILVVFRNRKRTIVPLDWEKVRRHSS